MLSPHWTELIIVVYGIWGNKQSDNEVIHRAKGLHRKYNFAVAGCLIIGRFITQRRIIKDLKHDVPRIVRPETQRSHEDHLVSSISQCTVNYS